VKHETHKIKLKR